MGYPDWTRLATQGPGPLDSADWTPGVVSASSIVPMGPFQTLAIMCQVKTGTLALIRVDWLSGPNVNDVIYSQYIPVGVPVGDSSFFRLPALTEYAIVWGNVTYTNSTGNITVYGDTRQFPLQSIPQVYQELLFDGSLNSGQLIAATPRSYASGPAQMTIYAESGEVEAQLYTYDTTLSLIRVGNFEARQTGWNNFTLNLPLGAWFMYAYNGYTAAQNVQIQLVYSTTGG